VSRELAQQWTRPIGIGNRVLEIVKGHRWQKPKTITRLFGRRGGRVRLVDRRVLIVVAAEVEGAVAGVAERRRPTVAVEGGRVRLRKEGALYGCIRGLVEGSKR